MRVGIFPKTTLGKWSVGFILAMLALFLIGRLSVNLYSSVPAGETIPQDIVDRPGVAFSMLSGFVCGVAAFLSGLVAIIRGRERAILVFASGSIGFLLLWFLLGEILGPH